MKFTILATIVYTATATDITCHNSLACLIGGNELCNWTCEHQGNPAGGRCDVREGCPGLSICACYPSKRNTDPSDGDVGMAALIEDIVKREVEEEHVAARSLNIEPRSFCCSLPDPWKGLCCEGHCDYIGELGGQCSDKNICVCN